MGERLLEQRPAIDLYLTRYKRRDLELSQQEWELLEKVVKLLEPFEQASREMCKDSSPISIQHPIAMMLQRTILAIDDPQLENMRSKALDLLAEKFDLEDHK